MTLEEPGEGHRIENPLNFLMHEYLRLIGEKFRSIGVVADYMFGVDVLQRGGYIEDLLILHSSALCRTGAAIPPMISVMKAVLEVLNANRDPAIVHVLLWQHSATLSAFIDLMELVP